MATDDPGPGRIRVYLSYSWQTEGETALVARLEQACAGHPRIDLIRDRDVLGYGDSITGFMDRLGKAGCIVAVISDAYLRSEWCMYEMLRIVEAGELTGRLFPIVTRGVSLAKTRERLAWVRYWEQEAAEVEEELRRGRLDHLHGLHDDLDRLVKIRLSIAKALDYIASHNNLTADVHRESDFSALIRRIEGDGGVGRAAPPVAEAPRAAVASKRPVIETLAWADQAGEDQYGRYADLVVKGVVQRFRWIEPGSFWMGSPEGEVEREPYGLDETRHEVTLTRGFWLADTACTQALWQAVMGKNPSQFKGAERPVETVSWEEVQGFIERFNGLQPGLAARLPTEAQWEYACRAGSTTPFWFGENITPEQVNYNGNYPYNGGPKGPDREQTVEVKALPCNGWGLYQMHGNVWEWCRDWYGEYPKGAATNPAGPPGGSRRVLRGGGWFDDGRSARSAVRLANLPGNRFGLIGFRLARGRSPAG